MSGGALEMLCAWCEQQGRPHGAARRAAATRWRAVPLRYVRAHWSAATHGVCDWCLPKVARQWGVEREAREAQAARAARAGRHPVVAQAGPCVRRMADGIEQRGA